MIKVFYTWSQASEKIFDPGFGTERKWDIPLLEGYLYEFVNNISKKPGSHHFSGIINPTLINKIEDWGADAILVFGWSFKSHLQAIRYFHNRKPVFFRGDSTLLDKYGGVLRRIIRTLVLKRVYSKVDKAFYVGIANRAYFKKHGLADHQLVFAPHSVDNKRFAADTVKGLRYTLNIPADKTVFLFAGKFEKKKNPQLLLEAFINLNDERAYLLMVGNGKLENELKKQAQQAAGLIQKRIKFLDFKNQSAMPGIYKTADVFVLPSRGPEETWGLSVNEAMASSLAVIVSDKCGCFQDLVQDNINGFVFPSMNSSKLVEKMKMVLSDKNKIRQMGKASSEIISNLTFMNISLAIEKEISSI